jgi:hypothetical protein
MYNLLEPLPLVRNFIEHPPLDFEALELEGGVPAFVTDFDLLTTMESVERRRIESLPLASRWRDWLRARTCFVGATVTEYALLPRNCAPKAFIDKLLQGAAQYPFVIIKDLPTEAVLVGKPDYLYSQAVAQAASEAGFLLLEGQALAYVPIDFSTFGEYLDRMPRQRRKEFRRKSRSALRLEIEELASGDPRFRDAALLERCYALYRNVYDQSDIHFDLLSPEFFAAVLRNASNNGVLFTYRANGELIGFNLCFVQRGQLIDKYVGFAYPQARDYDLYYVSWFRNLRYALEKNLRCYIAGWTDPEVKRRLGAKFTLTQHAVYVRNPLLRQMLRPFKGRFEADSHWHAAAGRP